MKSSTLHRASLSRERMAMLERARMANMDTSEIPQYRQQEASAPELDVLYKNMRRSIRKPAVNKTPGVYLGVGFVLGVLCMGLVALIVGISSLAPKNVSKAPNQTAVIIPAATEKTDRADKADVADKKATASESAPILSEEKYTIKSGDTLDRIAVRFYGKYDPAKIERIQTLNNIKNPAALQIGQVIIVPIEGQ